MYCIYEKKPVNNKSVSFKFQKTRCFFGYKSGIVPELLRGVLAANRHAGLLPTNQNEPVKWHLDFSKELGKKQDQAFVINLKPNNAKANLSLYEVADVWGYSSSGWTPAMLRLKALFVDADPSKINDKDFVIPHRCIQDPILSLIYFSGAIKNGDLTGKWTAPRSSPTNSVLLWPATMAFFMGIAQSLGVNSIPFQMKTLTSP